MTFDKLVAYARTVTEATTLQDDNISTNSVIAKIIPLMSKDNFVGIHSFNTSLYTLSLVNAFKDTSILSKGIKTQYNDDSLIFTVSFLHDVGKLFISETILNKPSRLTTEEYLEIKKHPIFGKDYLLDLFVKYRGAENKNILFDAVLLHHEKWDGSGYPNGIKGNSIPLIARIIAIADAFDAMTYKRPYSTPKTYTEALAELAKCSGSHFDPMLIDILLTKIKQGEQVLQIADVIKT